jgi:hypothetical protein
MSEQKKKSQWTLICIDDLPVLSDQELAALRKKWVNRLVWFYVGGERWRKGMVYAISRRGEVSIAVKNRAGEWVHGRVILLEYVPRVLRLATGE